MWARVSALLPPPLSAAAVCQPRPLPFFSDARFSSSPFSFLYFYPLQLSSIFFISLYFFLNYILQLLGVEKVVLLLSMSFTHKPNCKLHNSFSAKAVSI